MAVRARITITGIVQGVGFRPFVYSLATQTGLTGSVVNSAAGVIIDVEGAGVDAFLRRLTRETPPLASIKQIRIDYLPPLGRKEFAILPSADVAGAFTLVSPDVSVCADCLRELFDPMDRRYRYPFINCTNCGPRYSITTSIPYDRPNTTMAAFSLCPDCEREYRDPADRRFHAQPNACPKCGPGLQFLDRNGGPIAGGAEAEAVRHAVALLRRGGIVAIKGLGGFHLACDAANDSVVAALRKRKRKSNKPFAVMMPDAETVGFFCDLSSAEAELIESNKRPIVLVRKKSGSGLSDAVAPNNARLGCMLPYTPLHYLLFENAGDDAEPLRALVMTSGNLSEEPIIHDNSEAVRKLSGIADAFLVHNRDIFMRVDDSVLMLALRRPREGGHETVQDGSAIRPVSGSPVQPTFLRRSRGYAPEPIPLAGDGPDVLGCGADLKNTFTVTKGAFAIPSQHIGDMDDYETVKFYELTLANLMSVYRVKPAAIAHDLHPGYRSTLWAVNRGAGSGKRTSVGNALPDLSALPRYAIQHHYAHIGSVMAEHGLTGKVIGAAFDGTGYGADGNLWGGEFLIADIAGFERAGQFKYVPLPGGEAAIREPWRTAISYTVDAMGGQAYASLEQLGFVRNYGEEAIRQVMAIAGSTELSPPSSGAGRLFDAVSAMLGLCDVNTFEGEAATALESSTRDGIDDEYPVEVFWVDGYATVDFSRTIAGIIDDRTQGIEKGLCSTKFHNAVAAAIRSIVTELSARSGITDVALSGGTFQNQYLLNRAYRLLAAAGMHVHVNNIVPCNDAGISLGQAYLVRERLKLSP